MGIATDRGASSLNVQGVSTIADGTATPAAADFMKAFREGFITVDDIQKRQKQGIADSSDLITGLEANDLKRKQIETEQELHPINAQIALTDAQTRKITQQTLLAQAKLGQQVQPEVAQTTQNEVTRTLQHSQLNNDEQSIENEWRKQFPEAPLPYDVKTGKSDWKQATTKLQQEQIRQQEETYRLIQAKAGATGGRATEFQLKLQMYETQLETNEDHINDLTDAGLRPEKPGAQFLAAVPSYIAGAVPGAYEKWLAGLPEGAARQYVYARDNWIEGLLRARSGATITDKEYARAAEQYFPQLNESPAGIRRKRDLRIQSHAVMKHAAYNGVTPAPGTPGVAPVVPVVPGAAVVPAVPGAAVVPTATGAAVVPAVPVAAAAGTTNAQLTLDPSAITLGAGAKKSPMDPYNGVRAQSAAQMADRLPDLTSLSQAKALPQSVEWFWFKRMVKGKEVRTVHRNINKY